MTEDEAKTKACCGPRNNGDTGNDDLLCIASTCMAWRWDGTHVNDPGEPKGDLIWSNRSYGHCGLAGEAPPERAVSLESRSREDAR